MPVEPAHTYSDLQAATWHRPGMRRRSLVIRSIYAACLIAAAVNHARILIVNGLFWGYGGAHWASAAYWTSLTFVDPLVALLLFVRPRAGILATAVLIATNVLHNIGIARGGARETQLPALLADNPFLASQVAFLLFVLATARFAWIGAGCGRERSRP